MSFVRLSSAQAMQSSILLENIFIVEYMPYAPESFVKVYIYGLSLACREGSGDNSAEKLAKLLSLELSTVLEAFQYWANEGLIALIPTASIPEIEYLPVKSALSKIKKFNPEKYQGFNKQLEAILPDRIIEPNEFHEYYMTMEALHIEQAAMLEIITYCARKKGSSIRYQYILKVARELAHEGLTTYDNVHDKLVESELNDPDVIQVLKALKVKSAPDFEDGQLLKKWRTMFGFRTDDILYAAKKCKKGGMPYLDAVLTKYFDNQILSKTEMQDFDEKRDKMFALARKINYFLGLSYQQVDYLVETFISDWLAKGFEMDAILTIAEKSAKASHRSWEKLDAELLGMYQNGMITVASVGKHYLEMQASDAKIEKVLKIAGVDRALTSRDRDSYRTWTYSWGFSEDIVDYAASLSKDKLSPLPYMNTILAAWHEKGIKTLAEAQSTAFTTVIQTPPPQESPEIIKRKQQKADKERSYDLALQNEDFKNTETAIRILNMEIAKNGLSKELSEKLTTLEQKRTQILQSLNLSL